jgi:hypothetical protein
MDQTDQQEPAPAGNPLARFHAEAQALHARACMTPGWQAHLLLRDVTALLCRMTESAEDDAVRSYAEGGRTTADKFTL